MVQHRLACTVNGMAKLTDQLKKRTARSLINSDMPEWWPAAQIVGAVLLIGALVVTSLVHFGRDEPQSAAASSPTPNGPVVTAAPAVGLGTLTSVAPTTPQTQTSDPAASVPPGNTDGPKKGMPTTVDATTVSVLRTDGSTKALPLSAWLAARDSLAATYPNSEPTAVWVLSSTGASNTFSVELSNAEGEAVVVQVTAMLQASGMWAAS